MKTVIAVISFGVLLNAASASPILHHPSDPFAASRAAENESMQENLPLDFLSRCAQSWVRLADQSQPQSSDAAISTARDSVNATHDLAVCVMPSQGSAAHNDFAATHDATDERPQATCLFANVIEANSGPTSKSTSR